MKPRDPATTHHIMSTVRSAGGKADRALGSALWHRGLRYRRRSKLIGKPDLVFVSARIVVFVDGDFWHGRWLDERIERGDFKHNAEYWVPKLRHNVERDAQVTASLTQEGWTVLRIWESDIQKNLDAAVDSVVQEVQRCLTNKRNRNEPSDETTDLSNA